MYSFLAALIGALISIMIGFNGVLSNSIGNFSSTVVIHIVGLLCVIAILLARRNQFSFRNNVPLFLYSAGAIGVLTVVFNNISFTALGVSLTVALGLLGQSTAALVIDQFGMFGMNRVKFDPRKLIGFALISAGVAIMTLL